MLPVVESICTSTLFRLILHSLKSPQTPQAIADWASRALSPESTVLSDGLAGFAGGTEAGCIHQRTVVVINARSLASANPRTYRCFTG